VAEWFKKQPDFSKVIILVGILLVFVICLSALFLEPAKTGTTTWPVYSNETVGDVLAEWHEVNPHKELVTWSVGLDAVGKPIEVRIEWRRK
jgi:hypothetical protein